MEKIRPTPKETSQSLASLGYPALIASITLLTAACNLSSDNVQNLIPKAAAFVSLVGALFVISGAYILIKGINRK